MFVIDGERTEQALINVCLSCDREKCVGRCIRYRNAIRRLNGLDGIVVPTKDRRTKSTVGKPGRKAILYKWRGEEYTIGELAKKWGVNKTTLYARILRKKCSVEEAYEYYHSLSVDRATAIGSERPT